MYAEHHLAGLRTRALLAFNLSAACLALFARFEFAVGGGSFAAGLFWAEGVLSSGGDVKFELEAPSPLTQSALALAIPCSNGESTRLDIRPTSKPGHLKSPFGGPACGDRFAGGRSARPLSATRCPPPLGLPAASGVVTFTAAPSSLTQSALALERPDSSEVRGRSHPALSTDSVLPG